MPTFYATNSDILRLLQENQKNSGTSFEVPKVRGHSDHELKILMMMVAVLGVMMMITSQDSATPRYSPPF